MKFVLSGGPLDGQEVEIAEGQQEFIGPADDKPIYVWLGGRFTFNGYSQSTWAETLENIAAEAEIKASQVVQSIKFPQRELPKSSTRPDMQLLIEIRNKLDEVLTLLRKP